MIKENIIEENIKENPVSKIPIVSDKNYINFIKKTEKYEPKLMREGIYIDFRVNLFLFYFCGIKYIGFYDGENKDTIKDFCVFV